jgi:hypothetical protein
LWGFGFSDGHGVCLMNRYLLFSFRRANTSAYTVQCSGKGSHIHSMRGVLSAGVAVFSRSSHPLPISSPPKPLRSEDWISYDGLRRGFEDTCRIMGGATI